MWGFSSHPSPRHPSGEGASRPPWSFPSNGLWFQSCIPKENTDPLPGEEAQPCSTHSPQGVVVIQFPSWRGLCHQPGEPGVPNATHDPSWPVLGPPEMGKDRGWRRDETSRDQAESSPSKHVREALGTLPFAPNPILSHCPCLSLGCQAGGHTMGAEPGCDLLPL